MSAQSFTTTSIQSLFTFPFKDSQWKSKFLILCLINLACFIIPIIPMFFLAGYFARIISRITVEKGEPALPDWNDIGDLFSRGVKVVGAGFVYFLPSFILFVGGYMLMLALMFVTPFLGKSHNDVISIISNLFPLLASFIYMGSLGIGILIGMVTGFVTPVALAHVVTTGQFSAAFRFKEWWRIFKANWIGFFVAYVFIWGFSMLLQYAMTFLYMTVLLCCLIPVIACVFMGYMGLVSNAFIALAYREGAEKLAVPPAGEIQSA